MERDRNRAILKVLRAQFEEKLNKGSANILDNGNDEVGIGKVSPDDLQPLRATASALAALIQAGAQVQDLSEIYCVSCDFSKNGAANLSRVNFDRSYLRNANFTKANLEQSSFDGAYLMHTDFSGAHLRGAKLTDPPLTDPPIQAILWQKALWAAQGPIFECADLTEADFSGSVLFGFYWSNVNGVGYFPRFFGANLRHAKIASFIVFTAWPARIKAKGNGPIKPQIDLFPIRSGQSGQYNISVRGWDEPRNFLTTYSVGQNFQFTGQIRPEIWRSVYASLNSLASAENLVEADLPQGLRDFITKNPSLMNPIISTNCTRFR